MLTILAAMMMAQAPAQAQLPQPATAQQPAAKKAKPVCEYMELTGSRSPRRVCRDVNGNVDPQPGIQSGAFDKAQSSGTPGGSN